MYRHQTLRATSRASWFAELSAVLDKGERILAELIAEGFSPGETERLRLRLVELRAELGKVNRVSLGEGRIVGPAWPEDSARLIGAPRSLHSDWLPRRN